MNVKPIGAFKSGLIRQVVFERRGLKIQGPLYTGNNLDNYDKGKLMLQVRQVISLVTSHSYLPFCRHIIPILNFILIENNFGCYFFC